MHTTIKAIIESDGQVRTLEPVVLPGPTQAIITILENESSTMSDNFNTLLAALNEFPDDFMQEGREQPKMQDREVLF